MPHVSRGKRAHQKCHSRLHGRSRKRSRLAKRGWCLTCIPAKVSASMCVLASYAGTTRRANGCHSLS